MAELDSLISRVEQADLSLKTARSARERESAALTELWREISGRFVRQDGEVVRLRRRVAQLEDEREGLNGMIRTLLGAVESSVEGLKDETVPRIAAMAGELLISEAERAPPSEEAGDDEPARKPRPQPAAEAARDEGTATVGESMSPGIRTLISRIEDAFDGVSDDREAAADEDEPADDEADSELARDMEEIERLRDELHGLRRRISATG